MAAFGGVKVLFRKITTYGSYGQDNGYLPRLILSGTGKMEASEKLAIFYSLTWMVFTWVFILK